MFAHGGLGRGSTWLGVTALLRDRFTCVMLDQRGHGASDWGGGPQLGPATDDMLFVVERLGPSTRWSATPTAHWWRSKRPAAPHRCRSPGWPSTSRHCHWRVRSWTATDWRGSRRPWRHGRLRGGAPTPPRVRHRRHVEGRCRRVRASNPMLRQAFADLVVQAPSIATCLETVVAPRRPPGGTARSTCPTLPAPRQRQHRRPVPHVDRRAASLDPHRRRSRSSRARPTWRSMFAPHLVADALGAAAVSAWPSPSTRWASPAPRRAWPPGRPTTTTAIRAALRDLGGIPARVYLVDMEPGGEDAVLRLAERYRTRGHPRPRRRRLTCATPTTAAGGPSLVAHARRPPR